MDKRVTSTMKCRADIPASMLSGRHHLKLLSRRLYVTAIWLLQRNVLLHQDIYYAAIYRTVKYYYTYRADMWDRAKMKKASTDDIPEDKAARTAILDIHGADYWVPTQRGWRGYVDNMARKFVLKMLVSHGVQIIRESYGQEFPKHHNYVPPKPADKVLAMRITDMFEETRKMLLDQQNKYYAANGRIMIGREVMADPIYDMGGFDN